MHAHRPFDYDHGFKVLNDNAGMKDSKDIQAAIRAKRECGESDEVCECMYACVCVCVCICTFVHAYVCAYILAVGLV